MKLHKCKPRKQVCDQEGENQLRLNQTEYLAVFGEISDPQRADSSRSEQMPGSSI